MKYLVPLLLICCIVQAKAQHWTWIHGDSIADQPGAYGTRALPSSSNMPGGKQGGSFWTDKAGKFWLFGGDGGNSTFKNDLWQYDPGTNQWTWMKGDTTTNPSTHFGVRGISNANNNPPPLLGSTTWTDDSGNLWMFGGYSMNDLWKYTITTNEWTWVWGDAVDRQPSVYGVRGVPASTNRPGSRRWAKGWTDNSGNMWLFGGHGIDLDSTHKWLNDIWMYNTSSNMWTWVSGDTIGNAPSVQGTKGVPAPGNRPSGRGAYALWKDLSGKIWIYGGRGSGSYSSNDIWMYDPLINQWTWIDGDSTTWNRVWGNKYQFSPGNRPGFRNYCTYWQQGNTLWLMGGYAPASTPFGVGAFNDVWKYDISLNQWAWMGGDTAGSVPGTYGTLGVSSSANWPGGREDAYFWQDGSGRLYVFGGIGYGASSSMGGYLNDLWMLNYTKLKITPQASSNFFSVAPNPSKGLFAIRGNMPANISDVSFIVVDVMGRSVAQGKWSLVAGSLNEQLDLGRFVCGIYHLRLQAGNSLEIIRLVLR